MQNYVALYGFTRTMCFTGVILFWCHLRKMFPVHEFHWSSILPLVIMFCITAIFYLDFNKFYRRYTLEALMAFTALYPGLQGKAHSKNFNSDSNSLKNSSKKV